MCLIKSMYHIWYVFNAGIVQLLLLVTPSVDPGKPLSAVLTKEVVACGSKPPRSQAGLIFTLIENREEAR